MKKIILIVGAITMMFATPAKSQSMGQTYNTALGVKLWRNGGGITLKHFVGNNNALEGIGYFWGHGTRITGLYEIHFDIGGAPGLKWYIGPGAHVAFYDQGYNDGYGNGNGGTYVGIDGVLGLDYKFNNAPINLSLDWQPSLEFGDNRGFYGGWGGLGIRYTF